MAYLLGIDVSTTGAKALLIDQDGVVVASATHDYPLSTPQALWSEQDPADWWQGTEGRKQVVSFEFEYGNFSGKVKRILGN